MVSTSSFNQHPLKVLRLIVTNDTPAIADPENFSSTFCDYLSDTLKVDSEMRLDAAQLLQHPFFAKAEPLCSLVPLIILRSRPLGRDEKTRHEPCTFRLRGLGTFNLVIHPHAYSIDLGAHEPIMYLSSL